MHEGAPIRIRNGQAVARSACPVLSIDRFREVIIQGVEGGARLAALFADPSADATLVAALAHPSCSEVSLFTCDVGERYPSLTPDCPAAHVFEREIAEQRGIYPEGHPWLKPVRFLPVSVSSPRGAEAARSAIGMAPFFRMDGEQVHEVAVGPVHAGVIEPGHFRFQCHGEMVHHLEISLGYQHRGVERALLGGPNARTRHLVETLAGDSTIGHATVHARVMESLSNVRPSARAEALRAVAAELERLANHVGDLGALAGDVGFLPTMSYCGRIRGDVLNLTAWLCGNRFGRGMVVPGGVCHDVDDDLSTLLLRRLDDVERDATGAIELLFESPSVLARLEGAGRLTAETARQLGLVGVAARACGLSCDVRSEFPYGRYAAAHMPPCTWPSGDCFARAWVRWLEMRQSILFVRQQLLSLPAGELQGAVGCAKPDSVVIALGEGWRGEICHVAMTDAIGRFSCYKVVDPSFHNWSGLAYAMREQPIADFPLCNKSFNLSYCGHDL